MVKLSESGNNQNDVSNALILRISSVTGYNPKNIRLVKDVNGQYFYEISNDNLIWLISNMHVVSVGVIKVNRVIIDVYIPKRHLLEKYH